MSEPSIEQFVVTINFSNKEPIRILLGDSDAIATMAAASPDIESVETNCDDLVRVLEALAPFAENFSWGDEFEIDGVLMEIAEHVNGNSWFVPNEYANGVVVLESSSASWETVGPCIFDQSEQLLQFDDLYWLETIGDIFQQRVVVGRFANESKALTELADASEYCQFVPERGIVCELDEWGNVDL